MSRPTSSSKTTSGRAPRFSIEFSGDESIKAEVKGKLKLVRDLLATRNGSTTNTNAISVALDYWISNNASDLPATQPEQKSSSTLVNATKEQCVSERIQLITETSICQLVTLVNSHSRLCTGLMNVDISPKPYRGFAHKVTLFCSKNCTQFRKGKVIWNSPHDSSGHFIINLRLLHAFYSTGILPVHFHQLFSAANIVMNSQYLTNLHIPTLLTKKYQDAASEVSAINYTYYCFCCV